MIEHRMALALTENLESSECCHVTQAEGQGILSLSRHLPRKCALSFEVMVLVVLLAEVVAGQGDLQRKNIVYKR